jgi:hypothetical protein
MVITVQLITHVLRLGHKRELACGPTAIFMPLLVIDDRKSKTSKLAGKNGARRARAI